MRYTKQPGVPLSRRHRWHMKRRVRDLVTVCGIYTTARPIVKRPAPSGWRLCPDCKAGRRAWRA